MNQPIGVTIDDIFQEQLADEIVDPIVAGHVSELSEAAGRFSQSFAAENWQGSLAALLDVCRIIQRIRLVIGNLVLLDHVSRSKAGNLLEVVESAIGEQGALDLYLRRFQDETDRGWALRAAQNIHDRYRELSGEHTMESPEPGTHPLRAR